VRADGLGRPLQPPARPNPPKEPVIQNSSAFQYLAIDTIHESATNPRRTFDEAKLQELADSIRQHGLIQPITVRPNNEGFEIVAGARRYRASLLAEQFSIPSRIVELTDAQSLEWALIELSIVVKRFLCLRAAPYVLYM
jgi:ParB family chromosome partitioning protein